MNRTKLSLLALVTLACAACGGVYDPLPDGGVPPGDDAPVPVDVVQADGGAATVCHPPGVIVPCDVDGGADCTQCPDSCTWKGTIGACETR